MSSVGHTVCACFGAGPAERGSSRAQQLPELAPTANPPPRITGKERAVAPAAFAGRQLVLLHAVGDVTTRADDMQKLIHAADYTVADTAVDAL